MKSHNKLKLLLFILIFTCPMVFGQAEIGEKEVSFKLSMEGQSFSKAVNILILMTMLTLAPSFIMMMTSFTRIVIVLNFLKQAMGTQQVPSAKLVSSLALFLSIFIMYPVYNRIYNDAVIPFSNKEISEEVAIETGINHVKDFMLMQTRDNDLIMFMDLAGQEPVESAKELSLRIIIPAFMISEIKTAFQMGFLIYLPFLVIDLVIATMLMAMGMMMLPPVMISLPFKLLLFILVDGWGLLIYNLVASFG